MRAATRSGAAGAAPDGEEPLPVRLCALLWARPGERAGLAAYEDELLALLAEHGGRVVVRVRATGPEVGTEGASPERPPDEVHVLELPSAAVLDAYTADPRRAALDDRRAVVLERSVALPVDVVGVTSAGAG